ncbi:hypothetical protein [Leptolyngbya sp. 7M]|uniref:hypothetical protein n=1 Tax=Leptolyngbya sp. 7M TaxID=2812896 RepID=UPI001B8CB540|nr:hypothetical protein [Leptolyngbya sp. 7M]QYO67687.1 hypothetical protein JVX88_13380 [Leptolyngbya sp. 7M]
MIRGGRRTDTVLRIKLTGIQDIPSSNINVRIGSFIIFGNRVLTGATAEEPGVYTIDFLLPPLSDGAGDVPLVVEVNVGGNIFSSRLDDTTSRIFIL